jgi:hypothetical protein
MPKLKSAIAGLAVGTALTGGLVAAGAATTTAAAAATVQVSSGTPVLTGHGCRGWKKRCGVGRVRIVIVNRNHNRNRR